MHGKKGRDRIFTRRLIEIVMGILERKTGKRRLRGRGNVRERHTDRGREI